MTPEQAWPAIIGVLGALGIGTGTALVWAYRAARAVEVAEALDKLVRGNGGDDWSFPETRRRVAALARKADEYHETLHGEHGIYSKLAVHDSQILQWATWRHDVMDKAINRHELHLGNHDDDIEDMRKDIALCERRKS